GHEAAGGEGGDDLAAVVAEGVGVGDGQAGGDGAVAPVGVIGGSARIRAARGPVLGGGYHGLWLVWPRRVPAAGGNRSKPTLFVRNLVVRDWSARPPL